MNLLQFNQFNEVQRIHLVTFSPNYLLHRNEILSRAKNSNSILLQLGRILDEDFQVQKAIQFYIDWIEPFALGVHYSDRQHEEPVTKVIRLDNPLGEIPMIPSFKHDHVIEIGKSLPGFQNFISDVRVALKQQLGEKVKLFYKNDDLSYSVIDCEIIFVNKGNIFANDLREIHVVGNKTKAVNLLVSRRKNHRFISENGFLYRIEPASFNGNFEDDGLVFGEDSVWEFPNTEKVNA